MAAKKLCIIFALALTLCVEGLHGGESIQSRHNPPFQQLSRRSHHRHHRHHHHHQHARRDQPHRHGSQVPPPPPVVGSRRPDGGDCSTALIYINGCVRDLIVSFFHENVSIGRGCCDAVSVLSDNCFQEAFAQSKSSDFTRSVRVFCAREH